MCLALLNLQFVQVPMETLVCFHGRLMQCNSCICPTPQHLEKTLVILIPVLREECHNSKIKRVTNFDGI